MEYCLSNRAAHLSCLEFERAERHFASNYVAVVYLYQHIIYFVLPLSVTCRVCRRGTATR
jgi:hypothetical protein